MKRIIALILALLMLVFAGCGTKEISSQEEVNEVNAEVSQKSASDTEEPEEIAEETETEEEKKEEKETKETVSAKIDEGYLALIGKTSDEISAIKGDMSENLWADGPLYRFGPENVWYGFENYDFGEDNGYIPLDKCNSVSVPLSLLLKTDASYNADALESALGKVLTQGFDVMYETNIYSASYKNCHFVIYESSRESISADSVVNISIE